MEKDKEFFKNRCKVLSIELKNIKNDYKKLSWEYEILLGRISTLTYQKVNQLKEIKRLKDLILSIINNIKNIEDIPDDLLSKCEIIKLQKRKQTLEENKDVKIFE